MNLDAPERLKAIVTCHELSGQKWHLRKISVIGWRDLVRARTEMVANENDEIGGFRWGAMALSKQLCDEQGQLNCDTDEDREKLLGLSPDEMQSLLIAAHQWSGVWGKTDEQKKS